MTTTLQRALTTTTLVALGALAILALAVAPPDRVQGDAQRLMYLHVPAAWIAYVAYGVTSLASVLYLVPRTRHARWDRVAAASAELGVLFTAMTIALGSLWGRPVWGVWWAWDARLVTTAVLLFLYAGYLALRRVPASADARAKRSAIAALVAFVDVPVVHLSVVWWRTLHQQPTVLNPELNPQIHGVMATTLLVGVIAFTLLYASLLWSRCRLAALEATSADDTLAAAVARRRAAAGLPPLATPTRLAPLTEAGGR
jgi:heme exporter protein C